MVLAFAVVVVWVLKAMKLNKPLLVSVGLLDRQDVDDASSTVRNHTKAKFLARESARLIKSAIDKRSESPFNAYEDAAQALVLARAAKEIDDEDVARLSQDLGVDFFEYLSYAGTVVQDLRSRVATATA